MMLRVSRTIAPSQSASSRTGLMYNTKVFEEKGWTAPTSWNDLKDPKYKKPARHPAD